MASPTEYGLDPSTSSHPRGGGGGVFLPASLSPVALWQHAHAQGKHPTGPSPLPTLIGVVTESYVPPPLGRLAPLSLAPPSLSRPHPLTPLSCATNTASQRSPSSGQSLRTPDRRA